MLAGALPKLGPAFLTKDATMRTRYRAAVNGCLWKLGTNNQLDRETSMQTAQECELVADIEIAEQARVYDRVIASLEKEIASLHAKLLDSANKAAV